MEKPILLLDKLRLVDPDVAADTADRFLFIKKSIEGFILNDSKEFINEMMKKIKYGNIESHELGEVV